MCQKFFTKKFIKHLFSLIFPTRVEKAETCCKKQFLVLKHAFLNLFNIFHYILKHIETNYYHWFLNTSCKRSLRNVETGFLPKYQENLVNKIFLSNGVFTL